MAIVGSVLPASLIYRVVWTFFDLEQSVAGTFFRPELQAAMYYNCAPSIGFVRQCFTPTARHDGVIEVFFLFLSGSLLFL